MKMKRITFILLCLILRIVTITAQNDYLVTTPQQKSNSMSEEEQFIENNFPLQLLCKWTPGLKFMFIPDGNELFIPIFNSYETEKEVDSNKLRHKIFEFQGTEEKEKETYVGINYSTASSLTAKERSIIPNSKTYGLMIFVSKTHVPTLAAWYIYPM